MPGKFPTYTHDYFRELRYEYFETYSLWRNGDLKTEGSFSGPDDLIISNSGELHATAERISAVHHSDPAAGALIHLLATDESEEVHFMCAPFYRDAIIFYDQSGNIISTLDICMSCNHLLLSRTKPIGAGYRSYDGLKKFLLDKGHPIEKPTHFLAEVFEKSNSRK